MRVRFAPSPTGNLHIGSVRTALFNWVYARNAGGELVLRIEDTDLARSEKAFEDNILEGLEWLGLDFDEGPLRQSERISEGIYERFAMQLVGAGKAYYCFETSEELDAERKAAEERGEAYVYSRKSYGLSAEEVRAKLDSGMDFTIRFFVEDKNVVFEDLVRGEISFDAGLLGDFVILKSDGSPAYNFAVVVDDMEMKISHVVRGEDHISNTPRQILVYEALGAEIPAFAHLPIILGPDKSKLSKRHGAMSVSDYRNQGFLPGAILNYLSLLGWSPPDEKEILAPDELVSLFDISRVSKSGAVFDVEKLKWMNGQYIRAFEGVALLEVLQPFISVAGFERYSEDEQIRIVMAVRDNLVLLTDIDSYLGVFVMDDAGYRIAVSEVAFGESDLIVLKQFLNRVSGLGYWDKANVQGIIDGICDDLQLGKGKVMKPVRLAVSGMGSGPNLAELVSILGRDLVLGRVSSLVNV